MSERQGDTGERQGCKERVGERYRGGDNSQRESGRGRGGGKCQRDRGMIGRDTATKRGWERERGTNYQWARGRGRRRVS